MDPASAWWRKPSALGGLGVLLLAVGYAALSYVPPPPERPAPEHRPAPEQQPPVVSAAEPVPPSPPVESRSHVVLGRVAFYTGLALVLIAAGVWYRQPPAPAVTDEEEPGPDAEAG
jgi:hypothetical protein